MTKQLLHLVFGGLVKDPQGHEFVNQDNLDIIGIYPSYNAALDAWRGASQAHVDDAYTKYVIVHLHRLMEPNQEATRGTL
ncbi:MAG: DUF4170 domain-containing protein [Sphingomonadales bacterium]